MGTDRTDDRKPGLAAPAVAGELEEKLKAARAEFISLQSIMDDLVRDAPNGIPFSDGQVRIVRAAQQLRVAFERYQQAISRYREYVLHGTVPEDLREEK